MSAVIRMAIQISLLELLFCCACNHVAKDRSLFQLMENTGIRFENNVKDGKRDNSFLFRNFYNGGGVAIGDINNDGLADVFLTSNMGSNKLYLNKGNFKFDDITDRAGFKQDSMWSTGVVFVDINHDGWLDIYVCNSGHMSDGNRKNKLYINNHDLTFTESATQYGLDISAYTTQVSFFDYDNDGDLDCFMINNSPIPVNTLNNSNRRDLPDADWPVANFLKGGGDHLYRNDNGHFTEVTQKAGIHGSLVSFGLGVSVGDINGDGYPDVFVSNDSYERDYLYINQRDGTFKDELENWFGHTSFSSMGADIADINNDGYPEIFTTDMLPGDDYRLKTLGAFDNIDLYNAKVKAGFYNQYMKNCLQLNNRNGKFLDIADYSGVSATDWSWGALMFDMDNDGYNDIYVCNGVNKDVTNLDFMNYFANDVIQKMVLDGKKEGIDQILKKVPVTPMLHKAYRNMGDLRFSDVGIDWGFTQKSFSNGAAYGDLDNDGDLDLVINNENGVAFVYKNNARELNGNNYIGVSLKGKDKNTFAIGSKIKIYANGQVLSREVVPSRGFQSCVDYKQIIGLGKIAQVDSAIIVWPNRSYIKLIRPEINKTHTLVQDDEKEHIPELKKNDSSQWLLNVVKNSFEKHQEDENIDFYYEHNLPKMLSREGPKASVGDVNGDGLADVYIGGTKGHAGQLYLQTREGGFVKKSEPAFDQFGDFEDEAVLLFDADHDGDLDLFVGPGGNDSPPMSRQMQFRLFKNDGKGNFTIDAEAFPNNLDGANTGVAVAGDFNGDGFADLFVGGRSVPREYGSSPRSFLYVNDGHGHFRDIAETKNPDIARIGMVTGAVWADVTGDKEKELVIAGEWMAPRIFSFKGDHFEEIKTNLAGLLGWWETVAVADINADGKPDLILGNIGENFYLHPDSANPVKLWVNDFDDNGNMDNILTRTIQGKDMPVFLKKDMETQLPSLKKQNLKHADYARKTIQELFSPKLLSASVVKQFNYCSSIVAINEGNGQFKIQKLPQMVQLSSVNAIHCGDINGDGNLDLIIGGNDFGFLPQFARLDASFGDILLNDGKGNFAWLPQNQSGLHVGGQTRDIVEIPGRSADYFLFLVNDSYPLLYQVNKRSNLFNQLARK
ncbi:MAG: VCBS repeat-containing protein [Bacteroidota bacterium]|nr:VCBS repeat-containing protein [Bacteroidota bacterium]